MKPRSKYNDIHIYLNEPLHKALTKECFENQLSKQDFIRGLLADYFWRKKGYDVTFSNAKRPESNVGE